MENEHEEAGRSRRLMPGTRMLMALVAVITAIAIWLVPVDEKEAPPSLPELPSVQGTAEPLPLPSEPGMSGSAEPPAVKGETESSPLSADADMSGALPPPSAIVTPGTEEPTSGPATSESLALPPPPGGIATVTSGGGGARAFIYELQAGGSEPDPEVVFAEAERRQGEGNLEDAYLLYRYAARHGQVQAAMILGTQADPAYHSAESSYLPEPEPGQARKWYSMAAAAGEEEAVQRLEDLRKRLERYAAAGDTQAGRLLLLWR